MNDRCNKKLSITSNTKRYSVCMKTDIYIGTSGWHYSDWIGTFYPPEIKGYEELRYHATHFNTVENNSSFYRIAGISTYQTWYKMTPEHYRFSLKLNKIITHIHRLELTDVVREKVEYILTTTQTLKEKLGTIVIQLPPNYKFDLVRLETFLTYFTTTVRTQAYPCDVAIEFRKEQWFVPEVYDVLKRYNVALIAAQSSRYPEVREVTADIAYIRMHGPKELFASSYSTEHLADWAQYIKEISQQVKRIYVYFNNDYHRYAIFNAETLQELLM